VTAAIPTGLSSAEVDERVRQGRVNTVPPVPSRTIGEILRANLFTRFNALMATLVGIVVAAGAYRDALFGGVIIANAAIGILQEIRAKRTLEQLAVLSAPIAHVRRDGHTIEIPVDQVVLDDVLVLRGGNQIVADAEVLDEDGLEIDESLLTGEADAIHKRPGDELFSGSFAVTGSGHARVTAVGAEAYAAELAAAARKFTLANSELRASIDRIVSWVSWALIPAGIVLVWSQTRRHADIREALVAAVAGMVGMVPEGLVLLTSVAFAVGVVRLARQRTLVQELPAVETLARVDVVCLDKTGTITAGTMSVHSVVPLITPLVAAGSPASGPDPEVVLAALAAADPNPNPTQAAIAERYPDDPGWTGTATVPFSSARKWSAASFDGRGWWVLGAPELVLGREAFAAIATDVDTAAASGFRVLLLAHTDEAVRDETLPATVSATALVLLTDTIRPDAPATLDYFARQNVTLKVISGDNPTTVAAVARRAGLAEATRSIDARDLPTEAGALADAMEHTTVFGRVTPQQKRDMVRALQERGHTVAMTGDGVNDVLALKDSDCGIAMASGSEATRAVAQIVLLDNSFASLPSVVAEGRRVINNLQRVATLFLTKTTWAVLLAFATGITAANFPFKPRHLTLISTLCIGVPSFFLALAPNHELVRGNFLRRVARDSVPFGAISAAAVLVVFGWARSTGHLPLPAARSAAVLVLAVCSFVVLLRNALPLAPWKIGLVGVMSGAVALAFLAPPLQRFFELRSPGPTTFAVVAATSGAAILAMGVAHTWAERPVRSERQAERVGAEARSR
jgi:cation-transporting ATPase E